MIKNYYICNLLYVRLICIVVFLFIIIAIASFIKLLISGDNQRQSFQKIIGGLCVFIVSLLSFNGYVIFTSLFIGGLIIASEDFMKALAAILRTRGDRIPETMQALLNTTKATSAEVDEKVAQETQEVDSDDSTSDMPAVVDRTASESESVVSVKSKLSARAERLKMIESLVNKVLKGIYGNDYSEQVKITSEHYSFIVDGVVFSNRIPKKIIEIRYITGKSFLSLRFIIERFITKIKQAGITTKILYIVVSDDMTDANAEMINRDIRNIFDIRLAFFKHKDGVLMPVIPTNEGGDVFKV